MRPNKLIGIPALASCLLPLAPASAAIGFTRIVFPSAELADNVRDDDLANNSSTALLSVSSTPFFNIGGVNDGTEWQGFISEEDSEFPATIIFNFNTFSQPLGYTIDSVSVVTGVGASINPDWPDPTEPGAQLFTLSYSLIGDPGFTELTTVSELLGQGGFQKITLTALSSEIGDGVDALRFTWNDPFPTLGPSFFVDGENSFTAISEIDIFGSPVPEPTIALLGGIGLLVLARRKRS